MPVICKGIDSLVARRIRQIHKPIPASVQRVYQDLRKYFVLLFITHSDRYTLAAIAHTAHAGGSLDIVTPLLLHMLVPGSLYIAYIYI